MKYFFYLCRIYGPWIKNAALFFCPQIRLNDWPRFPSAISHNQFMTIQERKYLRTVYSGYMGPIALIPLQQRIEWTEHHLNSLKILELKDNQ